MVHLIYLVSRLGTNLRTECFSFLYYFVNELGDSNHNQKTYPYLYSPIPTNLIINTHSLDSQRRLCKVSIFLVLGDRFRISDPYGCLVVKLS